MKKQVAATKKKNKLIGNIDQDIQFVGRLSGDCRQFAEHR